jgi:hypothetical protein
VTQAVERLLCKNPEFKCQSHQKKKGGGMGRSNYNGQIQKIKVTQITKFSCLDLAMLCGLAERAWELLLQLRDISYFK